MKKQILQSPLAEIWEYGIYFDVKVMMTCSQSESEVVIESAVKNGLCVSDIQRRYGDVLMIYQSPTEEAALQALNAFSDRWDTQYPQISKSWKNHWPHLNTLFDYREDIRKAIYTTNAIESLNSVIRKAIRKRKLFPTDDSARKVVYLAVCDAARK